MAGQDSIRNSIPDRGLEGGGSLDVLGQISSGSNLKTSFNT